MRRSIRSKKHGRYSTDMIAVTANAACSIALRNSVFKGVPKALWSDLWEESRQIAKGDEKTLVKRRENMLRRFRDELGVAPEEIYAYLNIKGIADVDTERLILLGQVMVSIIDGDTSADEVFRKPAEPQHTEPPRTAAGKMDDIAAGKTAEKPAAPKAAEPKPAEPTTEAPKEAVVVEPEPEKPARGKRAAPKPVEPPQDGAPTVSELMGQIIKATTPEHVAEALDLARSLKIPAEREMVESAAKTRSEQLKKPAEAPKTETPAATKKTGRGLFSDEG